LRFQFAIVVDGAIITERTSRRIPLSRRSHITGFQPLATGVSEHESALERDFVTLTSFLDADASIISQPITLTFRHDGRARRYTPDFLVHRCHRSELVEVKYQADLDANAERLRPAFDAARAWANENRALFRIATEHDIRGPLLKNAKRLLPLRGLPVDRETAIRVLTVVGSMPAPSFGRVVAALKTRRSTTLATIWRLIARGELRVDLAAPITLHTRVGFPCVSIASSTSASTSAVSRE
jgi:TnsA endonuclease N terminal